MTFTLTAADRAALAARGLTPEKLSTLLSHFERGFPPIRLDRPCTLGDGTGVFPDDADCYLRLHAQAAAAGRVTKFVPASGAASRMFRALLTVAAEPADKPILSAKAANGDHDARTALRFVDELDRFAFADDLRRCLARDGYRLDQLIGAGRYTLLLRSLLTSVGLNYAGMPKGLVPFHRYADHTRSAFEEHLVEAAEYACDAAGVARIHFTVSAEHRETVRVHLDRPNPRYAPSGVRFEITYSVQKPATDTPAVDVAGTPVRDTRGALVFRPGGHGALLDNLGDLGADVVCIKTIDNVLPDRLRPAATRSTKLLCGYLIELQQAAFSHLVQLERRNASEIAAARAFVQDRLSRHVPADFADLSHEAQCAGLVDRLNRPLRVCGVVKNTGLPGGAPFWVTTADGTTSRQLVESSQVEMDDADQRACWMRATHFNPVDMVCGLRDHTGRPFDLDRFRDSATGFISEKSYAGRTIRGLEWPGLWNGGMAGWNTVFVEIPAAAFQPVKTVMDLLHPVHRGLSDVAASPPLTSRGDS